MKYYVDKGWIKEGETFTDFCVGPTRYDEVTVPPRPPKVDTKGFVTYYFDYDNGNDNNDGLTEKTPKKTVYFANYLVQTVSENLRILFKGGSTFYGNLVLENKAETRLLIVGKYPLNSDNRAIIVGDKDIVCIKSGNVYLSGLEITGKNAYRGIYGCPNKSGACKNIVVRDCYVHDVNFFWNGELPPSKTNPDDIDVEKVCPQYLSDGKTYGRYYYRYNGGIIFVNETETPSWFEDVWITDNVVENVARTGLTVYSKWSNKAGVFYGYNKVIDDTDNYNNSDSGVGYFVHKRIYLNDNKLTCCGGDGLVLSSAEDSYVEKNVCYYANYLGRDNYWNAGIWVFNSKNCYFRYNESAYTYMRHGGQDAQGFDIDNVCENVIMEFNYAHHNEGGGLLVCNLMRPLQKWNVDGTPVLDDKGEKVFETLQGKWVKNVVRNNVFAYNGNHRDCTRAGFLTIARGVDYSYFVNNTVVMYGDVEGQSIINTEDESQYCYHLYFGNNLIYCEKSSGAKYTVKMMKDSVFENNVYYNVDEKEIKSVGEKGYGLIDPEFTSGKGVEKYVPSNGKIFTIGKSYSTMPKNDIIGQNAENVRYVGAFSINKSKEK